MAGISKILDGNVPTKLFVEKSANRKSAKLLNASRMVPVKALSFARKTPVNCVRQGWIRDKKTRVLECAWASRRNLGNSNKGQERPCLYLLNKFRRAISAGRVPVNWLSLRRKSSKELALPIDDDRVPVNWLESKRTSRSLVLDHNPSGIVPSSALLWTCSLTKSNPVKSGTGPLRLLSYKKTDSVIDDRDRKKVKGERRSILRVS